MNLFSNLKILAVLMVAALVLSCGDDDKKSNGPICEVRGQVVDAVSQAPLTKIKVVLAEMYVRPQPSSLITVVNEGSTEKADDIYSYIGVDTVIVNKNGRFVLRSDKNPFKYRLNLVVRLKDQEGAYQSKQESVIFGAPIMYGERIINDMGKVYMTKSKE